MCNSYKNSLVGHTQSLSQVIGLESIQLDEVEPTLCQLKKLLEEKKKRKNIQSSLNQSSVLFFNVIGSLEVNSGLV